MSSNSKIAWTNALLPMQIIMAFFAACSYGQPVAFCVTQIVVIFYCIYTTIKTRKQVSLSHTALPYGCSDGIRCLVTNASRWGYQCSLFSVLSMPTRTANSKASIPTTAILSEFRTGEPCLAFIAPFEAVLSSLRVLIHRNTDFLRHQLDNTIFSLCHLRTFHIINITRPL